MKAVLFLTVIFLSPFLITAEDQCGLDSSNKYSGVRSSFLQFCGKIIKNVFVPNKNAIFSCFSLYVVLLPFLAAVSQQNHEYQETATMMGAPCDRNSPEFATFEQRWSEIIKALPVDETDSDNKTTQKVAITNGLFPNASDVLLTSYKQQMLSLYNATTKELDYLNDNQQSLDYLNNWVSDGTDGQIRRLLDKVASNTEVVMISCQIFKMLWPLRFFLPENTRPGPFKTPNGTVDVPMMNTQKTILYYESEKYLGALIRFRGNYSMLFVLPASECGTNDQLLQNLTVCEAMSIRSKAQSAYVNLTIPQFNFDLNIELKKIMGETFTLPNVLGNQLHLDYAIKGNKTVQLSSIRQAAGINVTQDGVTAYAATSIEVTTTAVEVPPPNIIQFNVNRPCAFYIIYETLLITLFEGKLENPKAKQE